LRRVKLGFAGLEVEFVDRERALEQVSELAERGTYPVHVVYGPEGCGKTALLRQAKVILEEEFGYYVVYVNPLAERIEEILEFTPSVGDVAKEVLGLFPEPYSKIVDAAISVAYRVIKRLSRPRIAVLMDDIFQAVGLDKAEAYTKTLLNLIEWPPAEYEKIVVLASSSEGVTWERVGRHNWATFRILWNMSRDGFEELYRLLPEPKPPFEEVWRLTGGNSRMLSTLFKTGWNAEWLVRDLIASKGLDETVPRLSSDKLGILREAVEDPDVIFKRIAEKAVQELRDMLIEKNLIIRVRDRDEHFWIDVPPPEKNPELGIGRFYAWQTPLHREAVRRALKATSR